MYCKECKVNIEAPVDKCPLCGAHVDINPAEVKDVFPTARRRRKRLYMSYGQIFLVLTAVIFIVSLLLNIFLLKGITWSAVVLFALMYVYTLTRGTILSRTHTGFKILMQALVMSVLMVTIQYTVQMGTWAVDYVLPFITVISLVAMWALLLALPADTKFMLPLLLLALLGTYPFFAYLSGHAECLWSTGAEFTLSVLSLVFAAAFKNKQIGHEIRKKMHS